jgi:hypothetical protein
MRARDLTTLSARVGQHSRHKLRLIGSDLGDKRMNNARNQMYKIGYSILFALAFSSIAWAEQVFREEHFGIEFEYDDAVSFDFNPHAMREIPIFYDSVHVGGPTKDSIGFTYTFNYGYEGNEPADRLGKMISSFTVFENDPVFNYALWDVVDREVFRRD